MSYHAAALPQILDLSKISALLGFPVVLKIYQIKDVRDHWPQGVISGVTYEIRRVSTNEYPPFLGELIGNFTIQDMPGCCGICISTATMIAVPYRHKGVAKELQKIKMQLAKTAGYSLMLCTAVTSGGIVDGNPYMPQLKVLAGNQWTKHVEFSNRRTHRNVGLYTKLVA